MNIINNCHLKLQYRSFLKILSNFSEQYFVERFRVMDPSSNKYQKTAKIKKLIKAAERMHTLSLNRNFIGEVQIMFNNVISYLYFSLSKNTILLDSKILFNDKV